MVASAILIPAAVETSPERPNIVLLLADDLGYGALGCYGQQKVPTPRLDRMAQEGLRFTNAYAGASMCAPSRTVLLTGKHTGHSRVRSNGAALLTDKEVTIAERLRAAGFRTAMFGKWGLGDYGTTGAPDRRGFDRFLGYIDHGSAHFYFPPTLREDGHQRPLPGNQNGARGEYSHDLFVSAALDYLKPSAQEPFFLYVPFTIPHAELLVPEDSLALFRGKFPETPFDGHGHYANQPTPKAAYAGMVNRLDRDVGRILDRLVERGLSRRTIVFFTSDNGATRIEGGGMAPSLATPAGGVASSSRRTRVASASRSSPGHPAASSPGEPATSSPHSRILSRPSATLPASSGPPTPMV